MKKKGLYETPKEKMRIASQSTENMAAVVIAKTKPFRIVTECDPEANACYVELSKKPVAKSIKQEDTETKLEYVLDYDKEGELVGIEILNMAKAAALGLFGVKQLLGQKQLA